MARKKLSPGDLAMTGMLLGQNPNAPAEVMELKEQVKYLLNLNDLSLEACVRKLANIAENGENDSIKLRAIDKALNLHGVNTEEEAKDTKPIINIFIKGEGESGTKIDAIFSPRD